MPRLLVPGATLLGAALVPVLIRGPFPQHVLIMILLYAALGTAWNILGGYAGQVSLGHGVYFGIGAYTTTLLLLKGGVSVLLGMWVGAALAVLVSLLIGWGTFRLAGHYFAIATLVTAEIAVVIATNWKWMGAAVGIYVPLDRAGRWWVTLQFSGKLGYYYFALLLYLAALLTTHLMAQSRIGYYFRAIKGDSEAARALGIRIFRCKQLAGALSAGLVALCGAFYAQYVLLVEPESVLGTDLSIQIALVTVLGGVGQAWGPLLGAAVLIPLSEYTRTLLGGSGSGLDLVIYGLLIILISVYRPMGLMGLVDAWRGRRAIGAPAGRA